MRRIVVFLTACLLLIGIAVGAVSAQTSTLAAGKYSDLNYSVGSQKTNTVYMGDILELLLGEEISDQEKNVIRYKFEGQNALYYKRPTVWDPEISYDGETEQLSIVVMDDYNIADNDMDVLWIPATAAIGDNVAEFAPAPDVGRGYYRAVLQGVTWADSVMVTLTYSADFVISANTLNDFVNFAYGKAQQLELEQDAHEIAMAQYNVRLDLYEQNVADWEAYHAQLVNYEVYLDSVALYEDFLLKQKYLSDVQIFEQDLAAYNANQNEWAIYNQRYSKYQAYLNYKAQYPGLLSQYQTDMALVEHQLGLLALLEQKDSLTGASFFDRMIDDRMTQVISERKDELALVVGRSTVNAAIESATALQEFSIGYKKLNTPEERYTYYIKEQANFAKHLNQLYTNIKKIYENGTVYALLRAEHPDDIQKMVRMMGSLYVYSCVFSDSKTMNLNTVVDTRGNQKASVLVDAHLRPASDTNKATPMATWPTTPVDPETYEIRTAPVAPSVALPLPTAPAMPEFTLVDSIEQIPAVVEKPAYMAAPTPPAQTLEHPGTPPSLPWDSTLRELYDAYTAGNVVQRATFDSEQIVTLQATVNHSVVLNEDEHYYFVYFYNTDNAGTYLGSAAVLYGESAVYPLDPATPSIPKDQVWEYEFVGWVDSNGQPVDLSNITQNLNVYASYNAIPRKYTVTWNVDGKLYSGQWEYGETPVFEGSTDKKPDAQYSYTFTAWDKSITSVTEDVTYVAQYTRSVNNYTITFIRPNGEEHTYEYAYGSDLTALVASFGTPAKPATAQYTYTFRAWSDGQGNTYLEGKDFPLVTGHVTYVPEFDYTINQYKVTWIVDDEQITETYEYGETPVYGNVVGAVPQRTETAQYTYTFAGWDHAIGVVVADVTYTATFDAQLRSYQVEFVVHDTVHSVVLEYGAIPQYEETPYKDSDVQYDYTFIGWDREFAPVTEDAVYTARFGTTLRKYPVTFVVKDTEITAEFDYGTVPGYPYGTPEMADDNRYRYVFAGWDKQLTAVDGSDVTYTARFDALPLAPVQDGSEGILNIGTDGTYVLQHEGTTVDLTLIFEKAGAEQATQLRVAFKDAYLIFPKAQIDAVYNMGGGIATVKLSCVEHEGRTAYQIELLDEQGEPVSFLVTELIVMLPYQGIGSADVFHVEKDGSLTKLDTTLEKGYLVFSTMKFSTFVIKDKFTVTSNAAENGTLGVVSEAYDGEVVTFAPAPNEGFCIDTVVVQCNGEQIELQIADGQYSFTMPKGNVQISATFKPDSTEEDSFGKIIEGGTAAEVMVGVITAMLIVSIGIVIAIILGRKKSLKI